MIFFWYSIAKTGKFVIQGGRQTTLKEDNDIKFARTVLIVN